MLKQLAVLAATTAALGLSTIGPASAHEHPCDNGEHHGDHHCPAPPPPAPTPTGRLIIGTNQADVLNGTLGPDVIFGRGGNDRISGRAGNDRILGGTGNDILRAGLGADTLNGGLGRDICIGDRRDQFKSCEIVFIR
jgi:Ca2+-binding RTX toxin-like protein